MRWTLLLALLPTLALAQSQPTPHPEDLGTVTGHVTCSDTQRPARLAQVRLVPVAATTPPDVMGDQTIPVSTDMSGAYALRGVSPGQYYLCVDLAGYITPIEGFTHDQLANPTPVDQQRMQEELQLVTVAAHATVRADATLRRSASISGTVLYEDGSPAISVRMHLFRRTSKGELREDTPYGAFTDPRGEYHVESVVPGDYIVQANLHIYDNSATRVLSPDGSVALRRFGALNFMLRVYSGNVFRLKEATLVKADAGRASTAADITIPLSRFHDISGTLLTSDGNAINYANVVLLFADDRSSFASVGVSGDNMFHFPYVPDGNYILVVQDARDETIVETVGPNGAINGDVHTLHTYGNIEQPITVQTSDQSLSLILRDNPKRAPNNSVGSN